MEKADSQTRKKRRLYERTARRRQDLGVPFQFCCHLCTPTHHLRRAQWTLEGEMSWEKTSTHTSSYMRKFLGAITQRGGRDPAFMVNPFRKTTQSCVPATAGLVQVGANSKAPLRDQAFIGDPPGLRWDKGGARGDNTTANTPSNVSPAPDSECQGDGSRSIFLSTVSCWGSFDIETHWRMISGWITVWHGRRYVTRHSPSSPEQRPTLICQCLRITSLSINSCCLWDHGNMKMKYITVKETEPESDQVSHTITQFWWHRVLSHRQCLSHVTNMATTSPAWRRQSTVEIWCGHVCYVNADKFELKKLP